MDILFVLIPLSVVLVLLVLAGLWWAIDTGQFEDINREGERILREPDEPPLAEQSSRPANVDGA